MVKISVRKRLNHCLLSCRTTSELMTDFMERLDVYIDHRIYEMLSSNATVEIPVTATYLLVACFDSKIDHMQKML